jgi:hypothetical protein
MRAEIFHICANNHGNYCGSVANSFLLTPSSQVVKGAFDLTVNVTTLCVLNARLIMKNTKKLATSRGNTVATASIVDCEPFHPKWVDISDYQASEINLEYSSVLSLHECHPSEEVQLRMIEDPAKSRNSVLEKFFIAPRYVKCENDPMNVIFVSHFFHSSLDNSVAVPKICLSLAREEFPGRYPNSVVSREFNGFPTPMTEVFLAILFRVNDGIYLMRYSTN